MDIHNTLRHHLAADWASHDDHSAITKPHTCIANDMCMKKWDKNWNKCRLYWLRQSNNNIYNDYRLSYSLVLQFILVGLCCLWCTVPYSPIWYPPLRSNRIQCGTLLLDPYPPPRSSVDYHTLLLGPWPDCIVLLHMRRLSCILFFSGCSSDSPISGCGAFLF